MSTPTPVRLPLLGLAYLGFISLGLPDGLLGVGWPSIRTDLGVPTEAVGVLLAVFTAGYLLSSVSAGFAIARLGVGRLLAGSTAAASLALTGYAAAPWLAMMVGCAVLLGLGSGAIDSGLNAYAAGSFGARHMNWLHASFGLGATIGPVVMTSVLAAGLSWRWGYGVVAGGQALLAVAFAGSAGRWALRGTDRPAESRGPRPTVRATISLPAVWLGAAAFAVYTAIEVAAGLWAYLLLTEGRGVSGPVAGVCVAAYWGSLFAGRLVLGMVAERLGSRRVLAVSLAGIAGGALLIAVPAPAAAAVAGLVLIGGAAAPVFPLLMLTTSDRVGQHHADRTVGVQVGAAALGGAVLPATIGVLMARFGVETLGPALLVLASLLLATYLAPAVRRATVDPGRARRAGDPPTGRV